MSITEKNKKAIFDHFLLDQPLDINKPDKSNKNHVHKSKQEPTNIANRKIGNAFFGNFGKKEEFHDFYHRDDMENDVDAFVDIGEIVYDPYIVMKN